MRFAGQRMEPESRVQCNAGTFKCWRYKVPGKPAKSSLASAECE